MNVRTDMTTEQRIKELDIRIHCFERMLSNQVYQLRCGKIIDMINSCLLQIPNPEYLILPPNTYWRILPYQNRINKNVKLIMDKWVEDGHFLIS